MTYLNESFTEKEAIQNRFTAYVQRAIKNYRIDYMKKKSRISMFDISIDIEIADEKDLYSRMAECEALYQALRTIKERERYVLLARVIDDKSFSEIAAELGLSYKGAAAIYYRALDKLRRLLGGEVDGF